MTGWERRVGTMEIQTERVFCGRRFSFKELELIGEVVGSCSGISRTELAYTVCELLDWKRPNGKLKGRECREFLETLEGSGLFELPDRRDGKPLGSRTSIPDIGLEPTAPAGGQVRRDLEGTVREFSPICLKRVEGEKERLYWRQLIGRYHYLGYRVPFGASLRYLIYAKGEEVVGGLQFSSAAWRMGCRDRWIGWDDRQRGCNLQKIVSNSRFLLLPWVKVRNLASTVLSLAAREVAHHWQGLYGIRPVLMETLVDVARYSGTCYRAANWTHVGMTTGRGRMDREGKRYGAAPKAVFVYPLTADFRRHLLF
jgi:hypothetical protein